MLYVILCLSTRNESNCTQQQRKREKIQREKQQQIRKPNKLVDVVMSHASKPGDTMSAMSTVITNAHMPRCEYMWTWRTKTCVCMRDDGLVSDYCCCCCCRRCRCFAYSVCARCWQFFISLLRSRCVEASAVISKITHTKASIQSGARTPMPLGSTT